jgi:hypothetical protein
VDNNRKAKWHGVAQWRQYPRWVRGPARIVGEEVVLDENRAEIYGIHERAEERIFLELAELAWGRNQFDPRAISSFVRRNGLLWHGADEVGSGECRESLDDWRYEALRMTLVLELLTDLRKSLRQGNADPLRRTLETYAEIVEGMPLYVGDHDLMDDVSVNLAELITEKLENCRTGLISSVGLALDVRDPGIFLHLDRPPDLLSAAYVHLAQFIADRAPMEECLGCGRVFIPRSGKQKYCRPSCASTTRWHRWKQRQAE